MLQETTIGVPAIKCNGCLTRVVKTLQTLESVCIITSDLSTKTLHLRYNPEQISIEHMQTALEAIHFSMVETDKPAIMETRSNSLQESTF